MLAKIARQFKLYLLPLVCLTLTVSKSEVLADNENQTIRVGVRGDAAPFSYRDTPPSADRDGCNIGDDFRGYVVDLCRRFLSDLLARNPDNYKICYVEVTTSGFENPNRFKAFDGPEGIDMLCGATTATLEVAAKYRVSLPIFLSTSTFMMNEPRVRKRVESHERLRVGFLVDTTSSDTAGPEAAKQRAEVLRSLKSTTSEVAVGITTHHDVEERICTLNNETEPNAGCKSSKLPSDVSTSEPQENSNPEQQLECPERDDVWNKLGLVEVVKYYMRCAELFDLFRSSSDKESQGDLSQVVEGSSSVDQSALHKEDGPGVEDLKKDPNRSSDGGGHSSEPQSDVQEKEQIDIYIADRPILNSILKKMELKGISEGIVISEERFLAQPYSVVFPAGVPEEGDLKSTLPFAFNRFLVEDIYRPGNEKEFRRWLNIHFGDSIDASFIEMTRILGRWPIGRIDVIQP